MGDFIYCSVSKHILDAFFPLNSGIAQSFAKVLCNTDNIADTLQAESVISIGHEKIYGFQFQEIYMPTKLFNTVCFNTVLFLYNSP